MPITIPILNTIQVALQRLKPYKETRKRTATVKKEIILPGTKEMGIAEVRISLIVIGKKIFYG